MRVRYLLLEDKQGSKFGGVDNDIFYHDFSDESRENVNPFLTFYLVNPSFLLFC